MLFNLYKSLTLSNWLIPQKNILHFIFSVHFPQNPKITAEEMLDIQFDTTTTTIKTADLTYEGQNTKSSDLCGVLGFVDDQGHIHLSSNFDLYSMRPKLTDFNVTIGENLNNDDNKLSVRYSFQTCLNLVFSLLFSELILMKNLEQKRNVVQYTRKNVTLSKPMFSRQLYQLRESK